ncbi:uncharacterized protein TRIVIDRAFT_50070 [Trichoderma virens Gv29-8]|uniref:F-box domain-containing protein n=1 Tax=Hypocrea virens (strain Gv29-8 / FGSC 10586) TaxID=413071 RepID=G9MGM2_HYPVG|nr:uncharacterized protein TRIVIDRAFT_50070 [Trichoderma virens Gv29-8]EHK26669.1 hypothetical protein TRIVIDRAFT_50070 [Trichoderma virens Gv29-8]
MNITNFFTRLVWRTSETQPHTHSHILQLPVELLLEIFKFLPPYSQLLVYRTCRPLRAIVYKYFLAGRGEILDTLEYRLLYLTHLARSLPDRWVCAKCCKLHQAYSWDTPSSRAFYLPKCGDGKHWFSEQHSESKSLANHEYSPSHRHVELTLKYARLQSQKRAHRKHLQRLLAPYHAASQRPGTISVVEGILAQRSFYPKVVDGRYLLLTVRTYLGVRTTISRQSIKFIEICPHLYAWGNFSLWNDATIALDTILYLAFLGPPNTRVSDSCRSCGTDFSVQASPERAIVCAWQDLGPEGTVYDPDWEAIVRETTNISHRPGSIRELYGRQEHNGEIL